MEKQTQTLNDQLFKLLDQEEKNLSQNLVTLLANKADPNGENSDHLSPLHYLAAKGNSEGIHILIDYRANPNKLDVHGLSPLHCATQNSHYEAILTLFNSGANPNINDKKGEPPLFHAVKKGDVKAIQVLIECGANPNLKDQNGDTPLFHALKRGDVKAIQVLIECGANPNLNDKNGDTLLSLAVELGDCDVILALVKGKADPNQASLNGLTPLHYAAIYGNRDVIRTLIDSDAIAKIPDGGKDGYFKSPLYYAVRNGHYRAAKLLLEHAPLTHKHNGETTNYRILEELQNHFLRKENPKAFYQLLDLLFKSGVTTIKWTDEKNVRSFALGCMKKDRELFVDLAQRGALTEIWLYLSDREKEENLKIICNIDPKLLDLIPKENTPSPEIAGTTFSPSCSGVSSGSHSPEDIPQAPRESLSENTVSI